MSVRMIFTRFIFSLSAIVACSDASYWCCTNTRPHAAGWGSRERYTASHDDGRMFFCPLSCAYIYIFIPLPSWSPCSPALITAFCIVVFFLSAREREGSRGSHCSARAAIISEENRRTACRPWERGYFVSRRQLWNRMGGVTGFLVRQSGQRLLRKAPKIQDGDPLISIELLTTQIPSH